MNIETFVKAVEEKTGETIVSVKVQKQNVLSKYLCKLGFHKWYLKDGEGHFSNGQCFNCGKYGRPC